MMKKKENCRAPGNKILDELFHLPEVFMLIVGEFTLCAGIGNWGEGRIMLWKIYTGRNVSM